MEQRGLPLGGDARTQGEDVALGGREEQIAADERDLGWLAGAAAAGAQVPRVGVGSDGEGVQKPHPECRLHEHRPATERGGDVRTQGEGVALGGREELVAARERDLGWLAGAAAERRFAAQGTAICRVPCRLAVLVTLLGPRAF